MANRPTQRQQAIFEEILEEGASSTLTRGQLDRLLPAQRNKILETRKLQNVLLEAQNAEDFRKGFANIKWPLIKYEKNIVYASGSVEAWEQYPHSWLQANSQQSPCALPPAFNSGAHPPESTWLVHNLLASNPLLVLPNKLNGNPTNDFIAHLATQGLSGNTMVPSTAFGGVEQQLRLHDVALVYHQHTKNYSWESVLSSTTWSTPKEIEDTIFALFSNYKYNRMSPEECETLVKRLPVLPINWAREFATNQQPLTLAAAVCGACLVNGTPPTKRLKKLYAETMCALTCMDDVQQNEVVKQILGLSEGFRNQGGMPSFLDRYKDVLPLLSPLARQTSTTVLIGEFISCHPHKLVDHTHRLLRSLAKTERTGFAVEHLQIMHKYIGRFMDTGSYSRGPYPVGKDLFNVWKDLRPYMDHASLAVVDLLSTQLRMLSSSEETKEWISNLNMQVNIKPQLLEKASKKTQRKI